jgi:hypothetical protein
LSNTQAGALTNFTSLILVNVFVYCNALAGCIFAAFDAG